MASSSSSAEGEAVGSSVNDDDEVGFLFLEDCNVSICQSRRDESPTGNAEASLSILDLDGQWLPIRIPGKRDASESESLSKNDSRDCCPHCHLTVQLDDNSQPGANVRSLVPVGPTPRFDGTTADLKPDDDFCICEEKLKQRSDGALLLGLAFTCQDMGHVVIRSMQILTRSTESGRRASLAITLSIPEVTTSQQQQVGSPSSNSRPKVIQSSLKKRTFISKSAKPLPPATQLLLSILRSDWDFFDHILEQPESLFQGKRERLLQKKSPFFPSKLALDIVYQKIGGASASFLDRQEAQKRPWNHSSPFGDHSIVAKSVDRVPVDIWQYHIGSYLQAKSLDALRCTNKFFYRILQEVVPGLRLRLYAHQVKSLSWMRLRETKPITENDLSLDRGENWITTTEDIHNAATGGATVLLRRRRTSSSTQHFPLVCRISQHNAEEVTLRSDDPLTRSIARGGLLCDDPGLGKSITVLSLVLQTMGLSTERNEIETSNNGTEQVDKDDEACHEEKIFLEYWKEQSIPQFRAQALNRLLSSFIRQNKETVIFMYPVDPVCDEAPDYFDVIANPICFQDIRQRINDFVYDTSFSTFQEDVMQCFRNATTYNPSDNPVHQAAIRLETNFLQAVKQFKQTQIQTAKKSFSRSSSKPNSSVAALVEKNNRLKLQKSLVPSSGTLLVVPSVLLEHWQDQIRQHVDVAYCTSMIPIVFEFTGTADNNLRLEEIVRECMVDNTHFAFLFIDKSGSRTLPSPQFLAMFSLVITTNQRFTNEWKNGSFEEELRQQESGGLQEGRMEYDFRSSLTKSEEACSLLKVNWLRMIVDEGHSMGRGKENSAISFASWIAAERRWAMTGTPTRQIVSQSGLSSLLNLVNYLQHDFFSRRHDGESVWQNLIARGWSRGMLSSFFRIRNLLTLLMVRHTKEDIEELPLPVYHSQMLPMSIEETKTYNTLVCAIQSNLAITSMKGKTSGLQDSLLHRSQSRHAKDALRNVRLVCAGGTQVLPTITDQYWTEFLDDFVSYSPRPELRGKMKDFLSRTISDEVSPCECCGTLLPTLLVIPCGDLVCTECFDPESNQCIVCDREFDIDVFQKLQPGLDFQWLHNVEKAKTHKAKALPAGARDVEESHASLHLLGDGRGVLAPLDETRERRKTAKPGDGHACNYNPRNSNGECELCWKEHDSCNLLNAAGRCEVCYREAVTCPSFETKPFYVIQKLLRLHDEQRRRMSLSSPLKGVKCDYFPIAERRRLKVIVFSQFRSVLNTVGSRLLERCGTACIAEYWGKYRKQELHKFIYDDQCFCLLLGKDGSEGLDLSFVTNIIFLEEVWDKSLEQQVVARAWRMGAKGSVEVETLVAENSVEQLMARLEVDLRKGTHKNLVEIEGMQSATEAGKSSEYQRAKLQFLLKNLRLITNSATNPLAEGSPRDRKRPIQREQVKTEEDFTVKRRRVHFDV